MQAVITENMASYDFFALNERVKKLQNDWHKFDAANLKILCENKSNDSNKEKSDGENEQIDLLYMELMAKMRKYSSRKNHCEFVGK